MKTAEIQFHQTRKANKPLTERRRRERINNSLMQLKTLVLRGTHREEHVKLEKADIMDMTVRYIEEQQQKQKIEELEKSKNITESFIHGYSHCFNEISKSLNVQWIPDDIRTTITSHLTTSLYSLTTSSFGQYSSSIKFQLNSKEPQSYSQISDVTFDRMATSTPCSIADDSACHQLSPTYTQYSSPSSENVPYSYWSGNTASSPSSSSVYSDFGYENSLPSRLQEKCSPVWRPW